MIDIKVLRENPDLFKQNLKKRQDKEKINWVSETLLLDENWRQLKKESDLLKKRRNEITNDIKVAKSRNQEVKKLLEEAKSIPDKIKKLDLESEQVKQKIDYYSMRLPNILHESVPVGESDKDNKIEKIWGKPKKPEFELVPHGDFLQNANLADFKHAAKIAGTGFYFLYGELALLDQALIQFALNKLVKKQFIVVSPPLMINREAYQGVTDLSDFENVMYKIENDDLYLIATSEHPICSMLKDEILNESDLPLKYAGVSPCFRREVGHHGIDTRGLFRVHQFNKVEQFVFSTPEQSWQIHEELLSNAEEFFQDLGLPYQVVNVCTGDIGTVAAKKYDLEVWMTREKNYREAVSCSNCTTYQAVRSNIKFRKGQEKEYVHTLNSTLVATSRAIRAIIEFYQEKDGTIPLPKVLHPYLHGIKSISPKK